MPVNITAESVVPFEGMGHFKFKFFGKSDDLHENGFKICNFILLGLVKQIWFEMDLKVWKSHLPTAKSLLFDYPCLVKRFVIIQRKPDEVKP
jgi:hypothetical protein